ncbi:MAG TPA: hypothetical protein VGT61_01750 [Thermomicrobiales bacterium]|jgi:hypothetical protein|nr:hypothetical protein [Thermomicrobiales bacterium]
MPTRDVPAPDAHLYRIRDLLTSHIGGTHVSAGGADVHVAALPLLKHATGPDDSVQAVRVIVASEGQTSATITIADGSGSAIATAEVTGGPVAGTTLLFIPEATAETRYGITATVGGETASGELVVTPPRKMTVHLVQHSHYDVGYTDPQAIVNAAQLRYLDAALAMVRQTSDWPEASRFRWVVEVTLPLRHWLAVRPRAIREAFIDAVRAGQIEVNALSMNMHTEAYSIDELARQLAFADELRHEHGLTIDAATQTDVPGATQGLVSLLADAGIRYLAVAHNYAGRSVPHLVGGQDLERPFWWRAPDGGRVLTWFSDSPNLTYTQGNILGFTHSYDTVAENLPEFLASLARNPFPIGPFADAPDLATTRLGSGYDFLNWTGTAKPFPITRKPYPHDVVHIRVQGATSDNAPPNLLPATIVREWNEQWAWPRLRTSTNGDFFRHMEQDHGDAFPEYAGDWTDWWADGIGSAARAMGVNRRGQSDVRTGQTLHTLAATLTPDATDYDAGPDIDATYDDLALFDEHTWGAANPWDDRLDGPSSGGLEWTWKENCAHRGGERAAALVASGVARLATLAAPGPRTDAQRADGDITLAIFNPSGHARTDFARTLIPTTAIPDGVAFTVVDDETGQLVPAVTEPEPVARTRPTGVWLTLLATDIPPLGYRRYRLVPTGGERIDAGAGIDPALDPHRLESPHLSLDIDPDGAFIGRLATADGRSLMDDGAPFGLNEIIRERYTTAPGFNHHSNFTVADGNRLLGGRTTVRHATVIARERTALWDRVTWRASGEGLDWVEATITLPHHAARVDIVNRIHKPSTPEKESLYVAFPFAGDEPTVRFEITGGQAGPGTPHVPGAAHYFRTIRHHATVDSAGQPPIAWATTEAPLVQPETIVIPYVPFPPALSDTARRPGTIYSWALNNLWDTNFPDRQGGEMTFSYFIATDADRPVAELGRDTGAIASQPLVGIVSDPSLPAPGGPALPSSGSFLRIMGAEVVVTHLARSRRGHDLVAFIESSAAEATTVALEPGLLPVRAAWLGTFLERDLTPVDLVDGRATFTVPAGALVTLSLDLESPERS